MENKELKFKTTLNCGGCVSKVQSDLDQLLGDGKWKVDTNDPNKVLVVSDASQETADKVVQIVEGKGFEIQSIH